MSAFIVNSSTMLDVLSGIYFLDGAGKGASFGGWPLREAADYNGLAAALYDLNMAEVRRIYGTAAPVPAIFWAMPAGGPSMAALLGCHQAVATLTYQCATDDSNSLYLALEGLQRRIACRILRQLDCAEMPALEASLLSTSTMQRVVGAIHDIVGTFNNCGFGGQPLGDAPDYDCLGLALYELQAAAVAAREGRRPDLPAFRWQPSASAWVAATQLARFRAVDLLAGQCMAPIDDDLLTPYLLQQDLQALARRLAYDAVDAVVRAEMSHAA